MNIGLEKLNSFLEKYVVFRVLKRVGFFVSDCMNFVLLIPVYFIGVGVVASVGKLFGVRFLELSIHKARKSYYRIRAGMPEKHEFFRQF